jgi:hypothetical protein
VEAVLSDQREIPARARELIRNSIHSLEALEALLWLRGAASRRWTAEQLARELRLPEARLTTALRNLVLGRLIREGEESPRRYQYWPQEPGTAAAVDELAEAYESSRPEVLVSISSHAIERVRRGLRTISDAFRPRANKKDD